MRSDVMRCQFTLKCGRSADVSHWLSSDSYELFVKHCIIKHANLHKLVCILKKKCKSNSVIY